MEFLEFSLSGLDEFLVFFGLSVAFVAIFLVLYVKITPYHELKLIREGNTAAAASLSGALLGFTLPLASAIIHSVHPWDMMIWGVIALVVQLLVFVLVRFTLVNVTRRIPQGEVASGVLLGAVSVCAGILNAACMTY
jgi:putative membrane protein